MYLSVILPVYNGEKTVGRTVESILKQTYQDFELIIIDDGSTDGTRKILKTYEQRSEKIRVFHQENAGASMARNAGIEQAQGRYVTFVDADDTVPEDAFYYMHQIAVTEGGKMIIGQYERIDGVSPYRSSRMRRMTETLQIYRNDINMLYCMSCCIRWYSLNLIRTKNIYFRDTRHMEDALFNYEFLKYVNRVTTCPHVVYTYYKPLASEGTSLTRNVSRELLEEAQASYEALQKLTKDYGTEFADTLRFRFLHSIFGNVYYRQFWKLDPKSRENVIKTMQDFYRKLSEEKKELFDEVNHDIARKGRLFHTKEFVREPLLTVAVKDVSPRHLEPFLQCLYDQNEPSFVVWIDQQLKEFVPEEFKKKENLRFRRRDVFQLALMKARSRYVTFVNENILYELRSLQEAIDLMEKEEDVRAVSEKVVRISEGSVSQLPSMEKAFAAGVPEADVLLSNKIIDRQALKDTGFSWKNNAAEAVGLINEMFSPVMMDKPCMVTSLEEKDILKKMDPRQKRALDEAQIPVEEEPEPAEPEAAEEESLTQVLRKKYKEEFYVNENVRRGFVMMFGEGDRPSELLYGMMREYLSGKYGTKKVYFVTNLSEREAIEEELEKRGLVDVRLLLHKQTYHKLLANAGTIITERGMPFWWIKKPGQIITSIWRGNEEKEWMPFQTQRMLINSDYVLFADTEYQEQVLEESGIRSFLHGKLIRNEEIEASGKPKDQYICEEINGVTEVSQRICGEDLLKPILLISQDLSPDGLRLVREAGEAGLLNDQCYLSAGHYLTQANEEADESIGDILPILWVRGAPQDSYTARRYWFGNKIFARAIILDCDNILMIRSVARFWEPVVLFVNDTLYSQALEEDEKVIKMLKLFNRAGNGICVTDPEKVGKLSDLLETEVRCIPDAEAFSELLA